MGHMVILMRSPSMVGAPLSGVIFQTHCVQPVLTGPEGELYLNYPTFDEGACVLLGICQRQ